MAYKKLSIVIPVYNEINTLQEILKRVLAAKLDLEKEIILVDDFSTDGTRDLLRKIRDDEGGILKKISFEPSGSFRVVFHEKNMGKGRALRTGFENVTGDITIIQDADLEYDPSDYKYLVEPIVSGEADAVYGSRFLKNGRPEGMKLLSFMANKFLTFFSNMVTGLKITDMETCYKVIRTSLLKDLRLTSNRFSIEPEITARLAGKKIRLVEIPVSYSGRDSAKGKKINWKDGLAALYYILKFNFIDK